MPITIRPVPVCAADAARQLEGYKGSFVPFVYDDAHFPPKAYSIGEHVSGTLTGGYGHTGNLTAGPVNEETAESWLRSDLRSAAYTVCTHGRGTESGLSDHQYAALILFVLNTGGGPESGSNEWTIWRRLRASQLDQVPIELMRFTHTHINGQLVESPGLVERRTAERRLWSSTEVSAAIPLPVPRPSIVQAHEPAPVPVDPDSPAKSKTMTASIATAVTTGIAAAPSAVKQATDTLAPYTVHSQFAAHIVATLATVGAMCALATVALYWWHKHKARGV